MCRSLFLYTKFLTTSTEDITLEDYLYMFRRTICLDITLIIVYVITSILPLVIGLIPALTMGSMIVLKAFLANTAVLVSLGLLFIIIAFWVADAILVAHYKSMVESAAAEETPTASDSLITSLWICTVSAAIGILVYALRFVLELVIFVSIEHMSKSRLAFLPYLLIPVYLLVKTLRVFAFYSFRQWMNVHWSSEKSACSNAV